jgi:asparagine synthase (glutamine-hydrolysing)
VVANTLGTQHHDVQVTAEIARELFPTYVAHIDEPYADGSAIPTYLLAQMAKDHVTVLLSGEGGDEFFAGYDTHAAYRAKQLYAKVPAWVRTAVIAPMVRRLPVSQKKLSFEFKAKRFIVGAELGIPEAHCYWRVPLSEPQKRSILQNGNGPAFPPSHRYFQELFDQLSGTDPLNRLLYIDASFFLPDDLMIKNDRMTMAHSLEARVPFTDTELVTYLATVPPEIKLKGMRKKFLLRQALRGRLPDVIVKKKKVGLEMPYASWMLRQWRDIGEDLLNERRVEATGLLQGKGVRCLWQQHQAKEHDHGRALWALMNYMLWHRLYIESLDFKHYLTPGRSSRGTLGMEASP